MIMTRSIRTYTWRESIEAHQRVALEIELELRRVTQRLEPLDARYLGTRDGLALARLALPAEAVLVHLEQSALLHGRKT